MKTIGKIVCKTVGVAGMSAALYDAYSVAKAQSARTSQKNQADFFERVTADTRTTANESPMAGAMQKKVANMRMNNPLVSATGSVKGAISGFFSSLGDNLIPVGFASLALAGKGFWAKLGAWGTVGSALLIIAREGFGFTKKSPMDN